MSHQANNLSAALNKRSGVFATVTLLSLVFGADLATAASEDIRSKKNAGMVVGLTGQTGVGAGVGLNGIYNVNSRVQLGVGVASTSWDGTEVFEETQKSKHVDQFNTDRVEAKEVRYRATAVSAEGRVFLGNSFNISAMAGSRTVRGEFVVADSSSPTGEHESSYNATGMVGNIVIGNHWTFDNGVVLGVDWLGVASGMSTKSKTETEDNETESSGVASVREDLKKFSDNRLAGVSLHLLGLRLGWTF